MEFRTWLEMQTPNILYHHADPGNRESISKEGLQTKYARTVDVDDPMVTGEIYLSDKPRFGSSDVWAVNVQGLPIEEDQTTAPEDEDENWYVIYQDIPRNRLRLLESGRGKIASQIRKEGAAARKNGLALKDNPYHIHNLPDKDSSNWTELDQLKSSAWQAGYAMPDKFG